MKLGPKLLSLPSRAVYHTGTLPAGTTALPSNFIIQPANASDPLVFGSFADSSGRKYVMVTNRDTVNSRTVSFVLPSQPSGVTEISKTTGSEVSTDYNSTTGAMSSSYDQFFYANGDYEQWDGTNWQDRVTRTNEAQPAAGDALAYTWGYANTSNKIRIYGTGLGADNNGHYLLQLSEIEVYNQL